jgi:hypothetical protein
MSSSWMHIRQSSLMLPRQSISVLASIRRGEKGFAASPIYEVNLVSFSAALEYSNFGY